MVYTVHAHAVMLLTVIVSQCLSRMNMYMYGGRVPRNLGAGDADPRKDSLGYQLINQSTSPSLNLILALAS